MDLIVLTEEQITMLKEKIGYITMENEELEKFKKLNKRKTQSYIAYARLVVDAFDELENICNSLDLNYENSKKFNEYLVKLESATQLNSLRQAILEYKFGDNIGDSMIEEDIKNNIIMYDKIYKEMIKVFFKLQDQNFI